MAFFKWERSYLSYHVSGSRLYYLNSCVLVVCKLFRYEVRRDLEPLFSEPPQHRQSYYSAAHLLYHQFHTKCVELRAVTLSAPGWQSCPLKGRMNSSVLFLVAKLQQ